ncbi:hypothetical protein PQQ75_25210 [Paraburkholderia aspalathi]|uniref:hypothetical protein n=1 Tax=Paraburkholderia aspalathi TaxID=1324617 RepID=UPI0038B843AD
MTPEDKELLVRAARAAGFALIWADDGAMCWLAECYDGRANTDDPWNPIANDVDAFRLGVRLEIGTQHHHYGIGWVDAGSLHLGWFKELIGGDLYAATRRVIVRAAAAQDKTP